MTSAPAVSFLCSAYRTEHLLPATIASVHAQTRADWEFVVVDGMSDAIRDVVAAHDDTRIVLRRQENAGSRAAWRPPRPRRRPLRRGAHSDVPTACTEVDAALRGHVRARSVAVAVAVHVAPCAVARAWPLEQRIETRVRRRTERRRPSDT